jgi:sugar/nucleoside kinase (ribokinase family)
MAANIALLCIGNAMVDVFAEVSADFCGHFDISAPVQHVDSGRAAAIIAALPPAPSPLYCAGGGAANTAKIAARLGRRGMQTAFAGAIGGAAAPDHFGRLFEEELAQAGVELYLARKKSSTGVFISLTLPGGERRIAAAPGAASELEPHNVPEDIFQNTRILMLEGFLFNRKPLIEQCLKYAKQYGLSIALDPGTAEIAGIYAKEISRWMKHFPVILFMNEAETAAFSAALSAGSKAGQAAVLRELTARSSTVIVEKRARRGAAVYVRGKSFFKETNARLNVESTGAGDAFAAGFLQTYLQGETPELCTEAGNKCAATVLGAPGTGL